MSFCKVPVIILNIVITAGGLILFGIPWLITLLFSFLSMLLIYKVKSWIWIIPLAACVAVGGTIPTVITTIMMWMNFAIVMNCQYVGDVR